MKANEFVKKYGWDRAKEILDSVKIKISFDGRVCNPCFITEDGDYVSCSELEPFVESYELVEEYNGLFEAKELIRVSPKLTSELRVLAVAIAYVESCQ